MSGVVITGDWGQNEVWNQTENCSTSSTPHHLMLFSSNRYFIYFSTLCRLVILNANHSALFYLSCKSGFCSFFTCLSVPTIHRAAPAVPLCLICRDDSSVLVITTSSSSQSQNIKRRSHRLLPARALPRHTWQLSSQHLNSPLLLLLIKV